MTQSEIAAFVSPIAHATRSSFEESVHHGAGVVIDADGATIASIGDPELVIYPRSALKPLQAHAMVGLGLELPAELLALVCASHSGEAVHLDGVRRILDLHDLLETDLQNTPARPYGEAARAAARVAGVVPSALQQNCSGKHAGMLATCRINDWPIGDYLDAEHPLQLAITRRIDELAGIVDGDRDDDMRLGVDGCGAPTHTMSLVHLATAFAAVARGAAEVAAAMAAHPAMVGGSGRDVTAWIAADPRLIAKEGAAGVMAAALRSGAAGAFKIADGSDAARQAVTIEMMRQLGLPDDVVTSTAVVVAVPVLGHGRAVGELQALPWTRSGGAP